MAKIKICGLRRAEDIAAVNACLPDYAGFVFAPGRRRVTVPEAARLRKWLDARIAAVGVFVDASADEVGAAVGAASLHAVQLHGTEDADYVAALRRLLPRGCEIWKAVRMRGAASAGAEIAAACASGVDRLLLDAFSPAAAGGTGERFDWALLRRCAVGLPFFLAGGLSAGNANEALACRPFGLDVSSGVETDGAKDAKKMIAFVQAVRTAGTQTECTGTEFA